MPCCSNNSSCPTWPAGRKVSTTANANCNKKKCYVTTCCPPKPCVPKCRKSSKDALRNKAYVTTKVLCCCPCPVVCPVKKTKCKCKSSKDFLRKKQESCSPCYSCC